MTGSKIPPSLVDGTAAPEASQRFPSSRSIDHRWDTSRGIIFNSARPSRRTFTWTPEQGIAFAAPSSSQRNYAVRSMDRTKPATTESAPSPPSRFSIPRSTPSTANPGLVKPKTYLKVDVLKEENDEMRAELKKLKEKHAELDKALRDLQSEHTRTVGAYKDTRKALSARKEEYNVAQNQAITKTQQAKEAQETARIAEEKRRSAESARNEIQLQLEKLQHLPIEAEKLRKRADQTLAAAEKLESKLLAKYNQLERNLKGKTALLEEQLKDKHKTTLELDQSDLEAKYETMFETRMQEHQQRQTERHDYASYRNLFRDLPTVLFDFQKDIAILRKESHAASKNLHGKSSVKTEIDHKPLAPHMAVLNQVDQYLEAQVDDATQRFDALESTLKAVNTLLQRLKSTSHKSRTLTRALHMEPLTDATIAENWYMESNYRPFEEESFKIKTILKKANLNTTVKRALNKEESDIAKLISLHTAIGQSTKMRFAEKEPLAEKIAFMQTYDAWETMYRANRVWRGQFMRDDLVAIEKPSWESDTAFTERGTKLNQDLWDLYEHAMKRAILGEELGLITEEELNKVNTFFEEGTAEAHASVLKARRQLIGRVSDFIESRRGRVASQQARRGVTSITPTVKNDTTRYTPSFSKTAPKQAQHVFWPSMPLSFSESVTTQPPSNDMSHAS